MGRYEMEILCMEQTSNYHLKKPDLDDFYDITVFNGNADTIDQELALRAHKVSEAIAGNLVTLNALGDLMDSGKDLDSFAEAVHSHTQTQVTGLADALKQAALGRVFTCTLTASGWEQGALNQDYEFWMEYDVSNEEIQADDVILIYPADEAAEACFANGIRGYVEVFEGGFTLFANAAPTSDIGIYYVMSRKED